MSSTDSASVADELFAFKDAAKRARYRTACGGRGISRDKLSRWHRRGQRGADGIVVRMQAVMIGRTLHTCERWIDAFCAAITPLFEDVCQRKELKPHAAAAESLAAQGL
jgi:hypothetical protein